jgi:hypothetical protein
MESAVKMFLGGKEFDAVDADNVHVHAGDDTVSVSGAGLG